MSSQSNDSVNCRSFKRNVNQLENQTKQSNHRLVCIQSKSSSLDKQLAQMRAQKNDMFELKNRLLDEKSVLTHELNGIEVSVSRLESDTNDRKQCVQLLIDELEERRNLRANAVQAFAQELDQMSQQFCEFYKEFDEYKRIDEEIKNATEKRSNLNRVLDQLKQQFDECPQNSDEKSWKKTSLNEWENWPINEIMIASQMIENESQMIEQEMIRAKQLDSLSPEDMFRYNTILMPSESSEASNY